MPQYLCWYLFGRSVHFWQWSGKISYYNCVAVNVFLEVLQDFHFVFGFSCVGSIYIYNVYVFLVYSSFEYYEVTLWVSLYGPLFEVYFVQCEYCYFSFFFLSICLEYLFVGFHCPALLCRSLVLSWVSWRQHKWGHAFLCIRLFYVFWLEHLIHLHVR